MTKSPSFSIDPFKLGQSISMEKLGRLRRLNLEHLETWTALSDEDKNSLTERMWQNFKSVKAEYTVDNVHLKEHQFKEHISSFIDRSSRNFEGMVKPLLLTGLVASYLISHLMRQLETVNPGYIEELMSIPDLPLAESALFPFDY